MQIGATLKTYNEELDTLHKHSEWWKDMENQRISKEDQDNKNRYETMMQP